MKTRMTLLAVALTGLMTPAFAQSGVGFTTAPLNLRSSPDSYSQRITVIPEGARVRVRGCEGSWCRVSWNGSRGWASSNYISFGGGDDY